MQVGKVCSLAVLPLSSSIQSCRNVAQYTAELAVKKKSGSSQAPYLFLRQEEYTNTEYSTHDAKAWAAQIYWDLLCPFTWFK